MVILLPRFCNAEPLLSNWVISLAGSSIRTFFEADEYWQGPEVAHKCAAPSRPSISLHPALAFQTIPFIGLCSATVTSRGNGRRVFAHTSTPSSSLHCDPFPPLHPTSPCSISPPSPSQLQVHRPAAHRHVRHNHVFVTHGLSSSQVLNH